MKSSTIEQLVRARKAWAENGWICIRLEDDREIRFPAQKNRRLRGGTPEQLNHVEIICSGEGLHWPDLNEDLSVQGVLDGRFGS
jgi:hypothetical protein